MGPGFRRENRVDGLTKLYSDLSTFFTALAAIPEGPSTRHWRGQPYQTTKDVLLGGKLIKLYAEGLAQKDHISFNLHLLEAGEKLSPCEMPQEKVVDFVVNSSGVASSPSSKPQ